MGAFTTFESGCVAQPLGGGIKVKVNDEYVLYNSYKAVVHFYSPKPSFCPRIIGRPEIKVFESRKIEKRMSKRLQSNIEIKIYLALLSYFAFASLTSHI